MNAATLVTFPGGSTSESAVVTDVHEGIGDTKVIVTDVTPFHPLDPWWPDQPSDKGVVEVGGQSYEVPEAVVVGRNKNTSEIRIGDVTGIRRGDPDWVWYVGHVARDMNNKISVGSPCQLQVDRAHRNAIAAGHTGCHVVALALNIATSKYWKKPIRVDTLGNNNFDQEAIVSSRIKEFGSVDHYRIGKGMKKVGFLAEPFWQDFSALAAIITRKANEILSETGAVSVTPDRTTFDTKRMWTATTRDRVLEMLCGGVHVADGKEIPGLLVDLERAEDPNEFKMNTLITRAS